MTNVTINILAMFGRNSMKTVQYDNMQHSWTMLAATSVPIMCTLRQITTILWPLYRSTCVNQQQRLRTGRFCFSQVLLPACPSWRQLLHANYRQDAKGLLDNVTNIVSEPSTCTWRQVWKNYRANISPTKYPRMCQV